MVIFTKTTEVVRHRSISRYETKRQKKPDKSMVQQANKANIYAEPEFLNF
jgi:hypothetical protein